MDARQQPASASFLTAEWRWLAMVNYVVPPELLAPYVPAGTTLDAWQGQTFVSVVGFLFRRTRVLGASIPWHRDFEEVNLRLYVKRTERSETRRGVVFIREIVPRPAIALLARLVYNEPYIALPMRHEVAVDGVTGVQGPVEYAWRQREQWSHVRLEPVGSAQPIATGSLEEFITEHYWGYTRQRDGRTIEYQVEHPRWQVWRVARSEVVGSLASLYGAPLANVLRGEPASAFLADGSAVTVRRPRYLR